MTAIAATPVTSRKRLKRSSKEGVGDTAYFGPELEHFLFDGVCYDQVTNYGFYEIDSHEANWDAGEVNGPSLGHKLRPKEGYFPVPPAARVRRLGLPCASDEMFELFDHELLITDNAFQSAYRKIVEADPDPAPRVGF